MIQYWGALAAMTITDVTCTVLVVPDCNANACDSAQDTVVVEVQTDEGITGIGVEIGRAHV